MLCLSRMWSVASNTIADVFAEVIKGRIVDGGAADSHLAQSYTERRDLSALGQMMERYKRPIVSIVVGLLNPPEGLALAYAREIWEAVDRELQISATARRAAITDFPTVLFNICLRRCREWRASEDTIQDGEIIRYLEFARIRHEAGLSLSDSVRKRALIEALIRLGCRHRRWQEALVLKLEGLEYAKIGRCMTRRPSVPASRVAVTPKSLVRKGVATLRRWYPFLFCPGGDQVEA